MFKSILDSKVEAQISSNCKKKKKKIKEAILVASTLMHVRPHEGNSKQAVS